MSLMLQHNSILLYFNTFQCTSMYSMVFNVFYFIIIYFNILKVFPYILMIFKIISRYIHCGTINLNGDLRYCNISQYRICGVNFIYGILVIFQHYSLHFLFWLWLPYATSHMQFLCLHFYIIPSTLSLQ